MEVLHPHCPGLDVHKDTVVACVRHTVEGKVEREVRSFKTTTMDLMTLSEWLSAEGCMHIVMEATGIYWKPVWHMPRMSRTCRGARPTSTMPLGWPT